jgi:hypothetical protein
VDYWFPKINGGIIVTSRMPESATTLATDEWEVIVMGQAAGRTLLRNFLNASSRETTKQIIKTLKVFRLYSADYLSRYLLLQDL